MKKAANVALGLAIASLLLSLLMGILLCAGVFGRSAFDIARRNGFQGSEQEWLQSLKGSNGTNGESAYDLYVKSVPSGQVPLTQAEWLQSLRGENGANGAQGVRWFSGGSEPGDVEGAQDGDFYLQVYSDFADRRGFVIYNKAGSGWNVLADMSELSSQSAATDYHIRSRGDLNAFAAAVAGSEGVESRSFKNKTIYLDFDAELSADQWTAIGGENAPFGGTFDGRGHTITLTHAAEQAKSLGNNTDFFGKLDSGAKIVNFTVHNVNEGKAFFPYVTSWDNAGTRSAYYGVKGAEGLAELRDQVNGGNAFDKQTVKLLGDVDLSGEANWQPIGEETAFKGTFDGNNKTISNLKCHKQGDYVGLFANGSNATFKDLTIDGAELSGSGYIGALLGGSFPGGKIDNVTVRNVTAQGNHYLGGVLGAGYITVENCHAYNVNLKAVPNKISDDAYDNGDKLGGIAGQIREYDTIHNCTADGVTLYGYRDMGGIAGYAYSSPEGHTAQNVKITVDQTSFYEYKATNVGRIFGYTSKPAQASEADDTVYSIVNVRATNGEQLVTLLNLVKNIKPTSAHIVLQAGTYEATANEQLRLEADNVTLSGAGAGSTVIDAKNFSCSGQAAFEVSGSHCTVADLTITCAPTSNAISILKVSNLNNETDLVEDFTLSHVTLDNTASIGKGHALNLHGVSGAEVEYLMANSYDKCGISLAKATNVTIRNTDLADVNKKNWANIGFMYSAASENAYKTHSDVTVDFATCTFGTNSGGATAIYSERPTASHDQSSDIIRDTTLGQLGVNNVPAGWQYTVIESGTWTLTRLPASSGSSLQRNR